MNGCVLDDAMPRSCSEQAHARRAVSWREGASHVSQRSMSRNTEGVTRIARQGRRSTLNCRGAFSTIVAEDCLCEDGGQLVSWHSAESVTAVFSCLLVEFETLLTLIRESRDTQHQNKPTGLRIAAMTVDGWLTVTTQHQIPVVAMVITATIGCWLTY